MNIQEQVVIVAGLLVMNSEPYESLYFMPIVLSCEYQNDWSGSHTTIFTYHTEAHKQGSPCRWNSGLVQVSRNTKFKT